MTETEFGFGIQWHLTDKCDQRCSHCYIWQDEQSQRSECLSIRECKAIVDNIDNFGKEMGVRPTLGITGGDPLLFPYFWEVAREINKNGWEWIILGNPFHLDFGVAKKLKEYGCNRYQMSIDGIEKTHDTIRKKGSFNATIKGFEILKEVGIISLVMTTVSPSNIEEIPDVTTICAERGVDLIAFARYGGVSSNEISPQRYRRFLNEMYNLYQGLKAKTRSNFSFKDHLWKPFFVEEGLIIVDKSNNEIVDGCHCGFGHLSILPNGDVYACRRFESPVGNALRESLIDIFLSDRMDVYRRIEETECNQCDLKLYCRGCPAVSFGQYGDWRKKDPQCWKQL